LVIWIAWNPLIIDRKRPDISSKSQQIITFIGKLLFGIFLCTALLLFEKFAIQLIAEKFHQRSYAGQGILSDFSHVPYPDLPQNASQTKSLLSRRSLRYTATQQSYPSIPTEALRSITIRLTLRGLLNKLSKVSGLQRQPLLLRLEMLRQKSLAGALTWFYGSLGSEHSDDEPLSSVLQPNSPQAMVLTALESAHRTKLVRIANTVYAVLVVIVWV
jgi:hypothetical protein